MKRVYIILLFILLNSQYATAQFRCSVSECHELTSIAFRLAGAEEYINDNVPQYAQDIDSYFNKYATHPLIQYIRDIRKQYGIGYDAVSSMTAIVTIQGEDVRFKDPAALDTLVRLDDRWSKPTLEQFITLLNDFYKSSDFHRFFLSHQDLYNAAEERMGSLLTDLNPEWWQSFYGKKLENHIVIISLCNGPSNYGNISLPNAQGEFPIVIGTNRVDAEGLPIYNAPLLYTIVHEINHSFSNNIFDKYWQPIQPSADIIYPHIAERMLYNAYSNSKTVFLEWLNNLFTLMYFHENQTALPMTYLIGEQQDKGFIWMDRSVEFMKYFSSQRSLYPIIDDYMPFIVGFLNDTAANFDCVIQEYADRYPYIKGTYPASGSSLTPDFDYIGIHFSEPMNYSSGLHPSANDTEILPVAGDPRWENETTFLIPIDRTQLEKGKSYSITLPAAFFQSRRFYPIKKDFTYTINITE